jgi:hypothetical protein
MRSSAIPLHLIANRIASDTVDVATWSEIDMEWKTFSLPINPGEPEEELGQIDSTYGLEPDELWPTVGIEAVFLSGQPAYDDLLETSDCPIQGDVWVAEHRSDRGHLAITVWPQRQDEAVIGT